MSWSVTTGPVDPKEAAKDIEALQPAQAQAVACPPAQLEAAKSAARAGLRAHPFADYAGEVSITLSGQTQHPGYPDFISLTIACVHKGA